MTEPLECPYCGSNEIVSLWADKPNGRVFLGLRCEKCGKVSKP